MIFISDQKVMRILQKLPSEIYIYVDVRGILMEMFQNFDQNSFVKIPICITQMNSPKIASTSREVEL